jgi:hypothetical protein
MLSIEDEERCHLAVSNVIENIASKMKRQRPIEAVHISFKGKRRST